MRICLFISAVVLCITGVAMATETAAAQTEQMEQTESPFDRSEYKARRDKVMEKIGDGIAVIMSAQPVHSHRCFFQSNDFYYLTGLELPDSALILDGKEKRSMLFFSMTEAEAMAKGLPVELIRRPQRYTGIDWVLPHERLGEFLERLGTQRTAVFLMTVPEELARENGREKHAALRTNMISNPWDGRNTRELQFAKRLRERVPTIEVEDLTKIIWDLRKIKSPHEIELLRRSAEIGVKAHRAAMQSARVGLTEIELSALFEYFCRKEGALEQAFYTIMISGPNHRFGSNPNFDRVLRDGDIVVIDAGPDYKYYNVDIATTFPANGVFTLRQKEVYELLYGIREVCLESYRPGVSLRDVGQKIEAFLIENGEDPSEFRYTISWGGYNHPVGLATHDVTGSHSRADEPLMPGFVFAMDIQKFYPDEELGVRLEDTILITEDGCEILSAGLPRTIDEIEEFMSEDGVIQTLQEAGNY